MPITATTKACTVAVEAFEPAGATADGEVLDGPGDGPGDDGPGADDPGDDDPDDGPGGGGVGAPFTAVG